MSPHADGTNAKRTNRAASCPLVPSVRSSHAGIVTISEEFSRSHFRDRCTEVGLRLLTVIDCQAAPRDHGRRDVRQSATAGPVGGAVSITRRSSVIPMPPKPKKNRLARSIYIIVTARSVGCSGTGGSGTIDAHRRSLMGQIRSRIWRRLRDRFGSESTWQGVRGYSGKSLGPQHLGVSPAPCPLHTGERGLSGSPL